MYHCIILCLFMQTKLNVFINNIIVYIFEVIAFTAGIRINSFFDSLTLPALNIPTSGYSQDTLKTTEKNDMEGDKTENTAFTIKSLSEVKDKTEASDNND